MDDPKIFSTIVDIVGLLGLPVIPSLFAIARYYRAKWKQQIEFSPATAFAFNYHDNFLSLVCESLAQRGDFRIGVVIPDRFDELRDVRRKIEKVAKVSDEREIATRRGKRTIYFAEDQDTVAYDVPRLLSALEDIITDIVGSRRVRRAEWQAFEQQEIKNFTKQLKKLVERGKYADHVYIGRSSELQSGGGVA